MRGVCTAFIVLLGLAGCGGDGDAADQLPPTTEATSTTESTTTTEDASIVRSYVGDLAPVIASWEDAIEGYPGPCFVGGCPPIANVNLLTVRISAERLAYEIELAESNYGPLPGDLAATLTELGGSATAVVDAHLAWDDAGCAVGSPGPCVSLLREMEWAFGDVDDAIVSWEATT